MSIGQNNLSSKDKSSFNNQLNSDIANTENSKINDNIDDMKIKHNKFIENSNTTKNFMNSVKESKITKDKVKSFNNIINYQSHLNRQMSKINKKFDSKNQSN